MKSTYRIVTLAVVVLSFVGVLFASQGLHQQWAGKSAVLSLTSEQYMAGGAVLPKGNYQVRCEHSGDGHTLVFRPVQGGKRVARVRCRMEELAQKVKATSIVTERASSQELRISEVRIGGEKVRHLLD